MVFMNMPLLRSFTSLQRLFSRTSVGNIFVKCKKPMLCHFNILKWGVGGEKRQSDEKMTKKRAGNRD